MVEVIDKPVRWLITRNSDHGHETLVEAAFDLSFDEAQGWLKRFKEAQNRKEHKYSYTVHHYPRGTLVEFCKQKRILPYWSPDSWFM